MKSCFTCKHRSEDEKNNWNEMPAYKCGNDKSFRHNCMVLKGMTCHAYQPNKSWAKKGQQIITTSTRQVGAGKIA
jgi:hypothetical protein